MVTSTRRVVPDLRTSAYAHFDSKIDHSTINGVFDVPCIPINMPTRVKSALRHQTFVILEVSRSQPRSGSP